MNERPDPDALLSRIQQEDLRSRRGHLKVFLGACAGVGKTYTMLQSARLRKAEGVDVVIGIVETHGRNDTQAQLCEDLELPRREFYYRGVTIAEFDLDLAVQRKPQLILVDELAHTNAPGSRHRKRWQDVKELLDSGIDVYTTLNVQHIESFNDVVAQVTGKVVQETVPDSFLQTANTIELVDLPFEELLSRLKSGKIYLGEQAVQASENFFCPGNIGALRELALRFTAERVGSQVQNLIPHGGGSCLSSEKILVLVGRHPSSAKLIRHACRLAGIFRCKWIALNIENISRLNPKEDDPNIPTLYLQMADKLGAETATISGVDLAQTALEFARERNVTRIIVGKPSRVKLSYWIFGSVSDQIVRRSGDIDVIVTRGDQEENHPLFRRSRSNPISHDLSGIFQTVGIVIFCSLMGGLLHRFIEATNIIMIYLLGVVWASAKFGRSAGIVASFLSVLLFDYLFIPPHLSFDVADTQYIFTFLVMLAVSIVISTLTVRLREAVDRSRLREERTAAMNSLARNLAMLRGQMDILAATVEHIADLFNSEVVALLPDPSGRLLKSASYPEKLQMNPKDMAVAQWVHDLGQMAGKGTDTLPNYSEMLFVPLLASHGSFGALGLRSANMTHLLIPEQLQLLESMAQLAALALEVDRLTEQSLQQSVDIDTERLRNALLSSVSHDLRTPLAAITGAASSLLEKEQVPEENRQELIQTIYDESERLSQQVGNLLEMSRLESGTMILQKELQPMEEAIGAACHRLEKSFRGRTLSVHLEVNLPMIPVDGLLLERVIFNLTENAAKYTPQNSPIEISVCRHGEFVRVEVRDHGAGLSRGEEEKVFDKFYRNPNQARLNGVGLGLTICKGIVEAHGGTIEAANHPDGGAVFSFHLPIGVRNDNLTTLSPLTHSV